MVNQDSLHFLSKSLCERFNLASQPINENVLRLFTPGPNTEVCRLELFNAAMPGVEGIQQVLGIAFHVDILNTDSITIFSAARGFCQDVQLLNSYYEDASGRIFGGAHAVAQHEHDKEERTRARTVQEIKVQQIEEWQMQQLERSGKLRIH